MKKINIILSLIFLFQLSFSQEKQIIGDTTYWFSHNLEFVESFQLKDFRKSYDEFNFRFRSHCQVVEISRDSSGFTGTLINFISHHPKPSSRKTKVLSQKFSLTSDKVEELYSVIEYSKILSLPSEEKIDNWESGYDGETFIIEHSDKTNYWFKTYWSPTYHDSLPEGKLVLNLINMLNDTLNLKENYKAFEKSLPKKGCYSKGGFYKCYVSNGFELGYNGATKLPIGFYTSYSASYIGKKRIDGSISLNYTRNNQGLNHLNIQLAKWNLHQIKKKHVDFIAYNYQHRFVEIKDVRTKFENHQLNYGLRLKSQILLGAGLDYLAVRNDKLGGHLFLSKRFPKPYLDMTFMSSIFESYFNYKAELSKIFRFNYGSTFHGISLTLTYEKFMTYKDLYLKLGFAF